RGVAAYRHEGQFLAAGDLQRAVESLVAARSVGIVTGFCIATAEPPAAETDGPPGALVLARVLLDLGVDVTLLSDAYGFPLLEAGCRQLDIPTHHLLAIPFESNDLTDVARQSNARDHSPHTLAWIDELLANRARDWSHLIAIERVGPSHTHDAIAQPDRDVCHNMRGVNITAHTAKAHLLFEAIRERNLPITTIGIADGGNEIGMGKIPWQVLCDAIGVGPGAITACRIATDLLIVAGVSNWGGYALAAAVARWHDRLEILDALSVETLRALIVALVEEAGAVDGVTRQRIASVDGLGLDVCLDIWRQLLAACRS
ncbi:MAG: DUF4392 domain-containing protein, partial [Planctomycetaceae bacterium]|nr:DUF4392 domain-containing protein [Planctomycetaceae bacterium]